MPKKVKKSIKSKKTLIKRVPLKSISTKKLSFLRRFALPILAMSALVLCALLYKNLLVSPEINMVTDGGGGGIGNPSSISKATCSHLSGYSWQGGKCVKDSKPKAVTPPTCPNGQEWSISLNQCVSLKSVEAPDPCAQVCQTLGTGSTGCQTCKQQTTPKGTPSSNANTDNKIMLNTCCTVTKKSSSCPPQFTGGLNGSYFAFAGLSNKYGKCDVGTIPCSDYYNGRGNLLPGKKACVYGGIGGGGSQTDPSKTCPKNDPDGCCKIQNAGSVGVPGRFFTDNNPKVKGKGLIKNRVINIPTGVIVAGGVAEYTGDISCYASEADLNIEGNSFCEKMSPGVTTDGKQFSGKLTCENSCAVAMKLYLFKDSNGTPKPLTDFPCPKGNTSYGSTKKAWGICCAH